MELTSHLSSRQQANETKALLYEFAEQIAAEVIEAEACGHLLPEARDTSWEDAATCREVVGETFFPGKGDSRANREARNLCLGCAVLVPCMRNSFLTNDEYGIKAGLNRKERTQFLNAARKQHSAA